MTGLTFSAVSVSDTPLRAVLINIEQPISWGNAIEFNSTGHPAGQGVFNGAEDGSKATMPQNVADEWITPGHESPKYAESGRGTDGRQICHEVAAESKHAAECSRYSVVTVGRVHSGALMSPSMESGPSPFHVTHI